MIPAKKPENEERRLSLLKDLQILDSELESTYDEITKLAAKICGVPICLVSLVDEDRQWFKSRHGLNAEQTPRDFAFCAHAILGKEVFEVEDARKDKRFHDNPLVVDAPNVIFYAGFPLELENNLKLGTLCVIDHEPKKLTKDQRDSLKSLSGQVITLFKLRKANQTLQNAVEEKANMLSTMSHEIRTPLSGVLGMTELLLDSELNQKQTEMLTTVKECGTGLLTILNDILDFSKLEIGKVELTHKPFSLFKTVQSCLYLFDSSASVKGLELNHKVGEGSPEYLMGDDFRLRQIIQNLISNAIKFTEMGGISVETSSTDLEDDKVLLSIKVRDSGVGIPKDAIGKLFKNYSQSNSSVASKYGGTGLGLAICKNLAELMDGKISVQSEEGKGTDFTVSIPFEKSEKPKQKEPKQIEQVVPQDFHILVAEDNSVNQIIAESMLKALGCKVTLVSNGREALNILKTKSFNMIFLDCHMPVMDGFTAAKYIKSQYKDKSPTIVALTASTTLEDKAECLAAGMDDFMPKPLSKKTLQQFFKNYLGRQAA